MIDRYHPCKLWMNLVINIFSLGILLIVAVIAQGELEQACECNDLESAISLTLDAAKTAQHVAVKSEFFYRKVRVFF